MGDKTTTTFKNKTGAIGEYEVMNKKQNSNKASNNSKPSDYQEAKKYRT